MISCNTGLFIPVLPDYFLNLIFKRQVWEDIFFFALLTCKSFRSDEYKNNTVYLLFFNWLNDFFPLEIKLLNLLKANWFLEWITLLCPRLMIPKSFEICVSILRYSHPLFHPLWFFPLPQCLYHSQGKANPSWLVLFTILANADPSQVPQLS